MMRRSLLLVACVLLLLGAKPKEKKKELTVTLDVKDAEVRVILKSMQKQCGIKNLIVDPNVQGKGTFFLSNVPCRTAFPLVLSTMGLATTTTSPAMVGVGTRKQ